MDQDDGNYDDQSQQDQGQEHDTGALFNPHELATELHQLQQYPDIIELLQRIAHSNQPEIQHDGDLVAAVQALEQGGIFHISEPEGAVFDDSKLESDFQSLEGIHEAPNTCMFLSRLYTEGVPFSDQQLLEALHAIGPEVQHYTG